MSRNELVDAYTRGQIGRRQFIKGMVATGASLVAATAYADKLRAAPSQGSVGPRPARFVGDVYDDVYGEETGGVTALPSTGIGQAASTGSSVFGPLVVAASAAAAAIGMRLRRMKGRSSDSGTE